MRMERFYETPQTEVLDLRFEHNILSGEGDTANKDLYDNDLGDI